MTAVDSWVLLDVFTDAPRFADTPIGALRRARARALVACAVVWAETGARFPDPAAMRHAIATIRVRFDPMDEGAAALAAATWRAYRQAGGKRERMLPDFLIGAHARQRGGRLLSRDAGFYRRYFRGLEVLP